MATDIVLASELGDEFDIGVNEAGKITLKLGGGLAKAGDGTLSASFTADPRIDLLEAFVQDHHVVQSSGVSVITAATPTDVINTTIGPADGGTYEVGISYMWSNDSANSDFESYFTLNGNELVTADAGTFLHRQEAKDHLVNDGPAVVGTPNAQRYAFTKVFKEVALPAGNLPVVFQVSSETAGVESAVWNVDIWLKRTSYP